MTESCDPVRQGVNIGIINFALGPFTMSNPIITQGMTPDIDCWQKTWAFAASAHATQTMPGSANAYLQHLGAVTFEIIAANQHTAIENLDLAIQCAMLHDTIEDQGISHAQLHDTFGLAVADGVLALSKRADLTKAEAMDDSLARIRQQPRAIWCVKLADRVSNLSNVPDHWSREKAEKYALEATKILEALGEAHAGLAERLKQRIAHYSSSVQVKAD